MSDCHVVHRCPHDYKFFQHKENVGTMKSQEDHLQAYVRTGEMRWEWNSLISLFVGFSRQVTPCDLAERFESTDIVDGGKLRCSGKSRFICSAFLSPTTILSPFGMPPTNGVPKVTEPHSTTTPVRRPPRMSITYGPSAGVYHTPSRSATRPFDWDAARGLKPAPYDTLATIRKRQSLGGTGKGEEGTPQATGARKRARIIMKSTVSWWEWFMGLPESWWFKLEMLWQEMPLPAAATTGKVVGFSLHILHALVRWSDIRTLRDDDVGWEDMRDESLYGDEEAADGVWIQWVSTCCSPIGCKFPKRHFELTDNPCHSLSVYFHDYERFGPVHEDQNV